jgi:hypothetical protein
MRPVTSRLFWLPAASIGHRTAGLVLPYKGLAWTTGRQIWDVAASRNQAFCDVSHQTEIQCE